MSDRMRRVVSRAARQAAKDRPRHTRGLTVVALGVDIDARGRAIIVPVYGREPRRTPVTDPDGWPR